MKKIRGMLSNWLFLCRFAWNISGRIWIAELIQVVMDVAEPFAVLIFPKFIIDELTGQRRWEFVLEYIALLVGMLALLRLVRLGVKVFCNMAVNRCDVLTMCHYAGYYMDMDYSKLEDSGVRDLQEKIAGKVHANNVAETVQEVLKNLLRLSGYAYLVFRLHPLVLLMVLAVAAVRYFLGMKREKNDYAVQPQMAGFSRKFEYLFDMMSDFGYGKEVRINQASGWLTAKFGKVLEAYGGMYTKHKHRQLLLGIWEVLVSFMQMLVMYGYAVLQALAGNITIGDFSVFTGAILNLSAAFAGAADGLTRMAYMSRYADDYKAYVNMARPVRMEKGIRRLPEEEAEHTIEFRNVSFRYPHTEREVLSNVSLTIADKEKLSIVGINGAGKTTLIKLLCRLYEPTEGVILYNGIDISTICYEDYVRRLSVVFQDFQLFAFSMEENIVLNRQRDEGQLLEAVRKSGLEEKLQSLPKGLDTSVGKDFDEEGIEFSGGEGQKLVTARAYYKNAPVVVLDEPTAALDPISENQVYCRFHEIMKDKTAIFISHRLASTRFCDRIAVFSQGKLVEYGTHGQLMDQQGLYCEMFRKQAAYYKEVSV